MNFKPLIILVIIFSNVLFTKAFDYKWSEPVNLSELNSAGNDFAPSYNRFDNSLYFNSDISKYSKFYFSKIIESRKFSEPKLVPGDLNQSGRNQSYITFESADNAYFSAYRLTESRSYLNIYQTRYRKMSWILPTVADSLQLDAFTSHPTVSPDGSIIIFSSDRNSGKKETDLWMAFKQDNGTWGSVINISELNSPGNEITPYLASKDTLYFASDGQEGPGGFDMFMSVFENGSWGRPYPLKDLNTSYNESDITVLPSGEIIFASDRPGGKGKLDLYISKKTEKIQPADIITENIEINIAAQVMSLESKKVNSTQTYFIPNFILHKFLNNKKELILSNNPDSIFSLTLPIIGQRMKENSNASLNIVCEKNYEVEAENFIKQFKNDYNLTDDRIKLQTNPVKFGTPTQRSDLIYLTSNIDNMFNSIDAVSEEVTIIPPVLELNIDARPRKNIKSWSCSLITKNNKLDNIYKSETLPADIPLKLSDYRSMIDESDSVIIKIEAEDNNGKIHTNNLVLNISHSSIKETNSFSSNGKPHQQYIFFANRESVQNNNNSFRKLVTKLKENSISKVTVQYNVQNNSTIATADEIAALLKKENISAKSEFMNLTTLSISDLVKPYLFRILFDQ